MGAWVRKNPFVGRPSKENLTGIGKYAEKKKRKAFRQRSKG